MVRTMVKIHGNYCGPNWTGGKKLSAEDFIAQGHTWIRPIDWLDRLCMDHDRSCGEAKDMGCSKKADQKLLDGISKWYRNPFNPIFHPIQNVKAQAVREGINLAQPWRKH